MTCTAINPHRCRTHGTPTRHAITEEAKSLGWHVTRSPLADMYEREVEGVHEGIIMYWLEADPYWLGAGVAKVRQGGKYEIDRSPLSLVTARRWLGSKEV